jgi:hypothetical protein
LYENPFDAKKLLDLDDFEFEQEVDGLIEWCEDLDYDKYMDNWQQIATSAKHDAVPNDNSLHVAGNDEFGGK